MLDLSCLLRQLHSHPLDLLLDVRPDIADLTLNVNAHLHFNKVLQVKYYQKVRMNNAISFNVVVILLCMVFLKVIYLAIYKYIQ